MFDTLDRKIIQMMQNEFPLVAEPYKELASQIGISEEELLKRLQRYQKEGQIRKMGVVLWHRKVGFAANALCAWQAPADRLEEAGTMMAQMPSVTHCYTRTPYADWPYNLYTMIHAQTREECKQLAEELAALTRLTDYTLLFSTKEWKKASMRYFQEG